jgi:hypothetical protein
MIKLSAMHAPIYVRDAFRLNITSHCPLCICSVVSEKSQRSHRMGATCSLVRAIKINYALVMVSVVVTRGTITEVLLAIILIKLHEEDILQR